MTICINKYSFCLFNYFSNKFFGVAAIGGTFVRQDNSKENKKKNNEKILQGDRLGIIKFGSRVDLYLPLNYQTLVAVGQTVKGGETIISNPNNISKLIKTIIK